MTAKTYVIEILAVRLDERQTELENLQDKVPQLERARVLAADGNIRQVIENVVKLLSLL